MSPRRRPRALRGGSFPRVSGDEPLVDVAAGLLREFSPRERG